MGVIFQVPAWLLLVGSVVAGFYAYATKINNISLLVPIILLAIFVLYIIGRLMVRSAKDNFNELPREEEKEETEVIRPARVRL